MKKGSMQPPSSATPFLPILATLALVLLARPAAALDAPSAPALSNGTYTVTYPPCSGCAATWLEERAGETGSWRYAGTGEVRYSSKADGRYYYRVGYLYLNFDYSTYTLYGPTGSVLVSADLPRPEPLQTQLTYRYESRRGDLDGDGRMDLFVKRTQGGRSGDGTIDAVILRQAAGGAFATIDPSSSQRHVAESWVKVSLGILLKDVNVDGLADLVLSGVAGAVGKSGLQNQVVYARGGAASSRVRALDSSFKRFAGDIADYLRDPDYFRTHAPMGYLQRTFWTSVCSSYGGGYDGPAGYSFDCYLVPVVVVSPYPDYSVFDADALKIWTLETAADGKQLTPRDVQARIGDVVDGVTGAEVGGWGELEPFDPIRSSLDAEARRGIELFTALLRISEAGAAEPEDTASRARRADQVYVTGRRIIGFLPFHTALEYAGSTISAHDTDPSAFIDGFLVSEVNWGPDRPLLTMTLGTVSSSIATTAYWSRLRTADAGYSDRLPYDTIPSIGKGGYNSNGYTHGIVLATAGASSIDLNGFVGGERPVPASEYY